MMSPLESRLVLGISIFFNFYFLCSITAQLLLLYLMIKCAVTSLRDMRIYLFNILALQFISTVSAYVLQCRVVPSSETLAMLCYGPCKYLGVIPCQIMFHLLQTSLIACATSLIIAFYYRYELLTTNSFTRNSHYKQLVMSYCVPLFFLVFEVLSPSDLSKIEQELGALHSSYDTDNYVIVGFSEVRSVVASIQTLLLMVGLYGTPCIALVFRRKIMNLLNATKSYHAEKMAQTKSMVKGLTIQTLLPLLCYVPGFTYYVFAQYSNSSSLITEFAVSPFGFLYTFIDPLLTIYYVLPYRRSFKLLFARKPSVSATVFSLSEANASRRHVV